MGFLNIGLKNDPAPSEGGGLIAKLMSRIKDEGAAQQQQYNYDPSTQQYQAMAKGGTASSRADGIAQRGKTKGKVC
jgi:hypothetical protein